MEKPTISFQNKIESLRLRCDELCEQFDDFTDGMRMLLLLQRKKDGGHNNEEQRIFESYVTKSKEDFKQKLFNLLLIKSTQKYPTRIYLSACERDVKKIIRNIEYELLDLHYADVERREASHMKILRAPRHFIMKPENAAEKLFMIDVDDKDGEDMMGGALREMESLGVEEIIRYRTKSGWHIVVKPFNPALWTHKSEIKKDPMLLLDW